MAYRPRRMNKKPVEPALRNLFRGERKSWARWFRWGVAFRWRFRLEPLVPKIADDDGHRSDCAVNNEPAYPAGPYDCGKGE